MLFKRMITFILNLFFILVLSFNAGPSCGDIIDNYKESKAEEKAYKADITTRILQAESYLSEGNLNEAEKLYDSLLNNPTDPYFQANAVNESLRKFYVAEVFENEASAQKYPDGVMVVDPRTGVYYVVGGIYKRAAEKWVDSYLAKFSASEGDFDFECSSPVFHYALIYWSQNKIASRNEQVFQFRNNTNSVDKNETYLGEFIHQNCEDDGKSLNQDPGADPWSPEEIPLVENYDETQDESSYWDYFMDSYAHNYLCRGLFDSIDFYTSANSGVIGDEAEIVSAAEASGCNMGNYYDYR